MAFINQSFEAHYEPGGTPTNTSGGVTITVTKPGPVTVVATTAMTNTATGVYRYNSSATPFETGVLHTVKIVFTDTLGTVTETFTFTPSTVTVTGSGSAHSGFLTTTIRRIRAMTDEPDVDAKYRDAYLIADVIEPAVAQVWSDVGLTSSNHIRAQATIALAANTSEYLLPPTVGRLWRVFTPHASSGVAQYEAVPRGDLNLQGWGYRISGNKLVFNPTPDQAYTLTIEFTPTMDLRLHKGSGTRNVSDATKMTLDPSPDQGSLDNRPNAYVGALCRVLDDGNSPIREQERVITAHDVSTGVITVSPAFSPALGANVTYEIAPMAGPALYNAVAMRGALTLLASKGGAASRYQKVMAEYVAAMKALRETVTNMEARVGKRFQADVPDHPDRWPFLSGPMVFVSAGS